MCFKKKEECLTHSDESKEEAEEEEQAQQEAQQPLPPAAAGEEPGVGFIPTDFWKRNSSRVTFNCSLQIYVM